MYQLPPIEQFRSSPPEEQKVVIDHLFEPCDSLNWFIQSCVIKKNYESYAEFINLVRNELEILVYRNGFFAVRNGFEANTLINEIISAHPRLGAPKHTKLSQHSAEEQKKLGGEQMQKRLAELNEEYEKTFPGLRYVVFVNGRSRDEIIANMEKRIKRNDIELEKKEAFEAMCDIALDRAAKMDVFKL
ncbi:OHCU decarboxylase family protein [Candida parapsilosis]|uniref:OHCU_decarbox domain-containing protein n=2 Tax=Candida parapsilosis TaxID=5480 RepID=G8BGY7_CANPC|nr:uncharacterized protein CPAR2_503590 [Candida parapsilosis]KAF6044743.1 OHCU decarboxylase family protein [Candida parapsilosis]KAF6044870.1 OHCU decarboxylase family protein [Candida parapsilosis]KAF6048983.1 OHCU decarboxylase family protein [Candida parapsilosis]KAF6060983.1 OHCU decarboxylase family protein [Candida parapsilosis]KAI5902548.1 allantoinase 1 [Candida parapsilosis]